MSPKKILFCTVCNNKYAPGLEVLVSTLLEYNPWLINHSFKVYHRDDLSTENQKKLATIYPHFIFEKVDDPAYFGKDAHYMSLLPFKEYDFERVVFVDADMMCLGDISALLKTKKPFSACLDYDINFPKNKNLTYIPYFLRPMFYVNTGLFVLVGKQYKNPMFYQKLHAEIEHNENLRQQGKQTLHDQAIIKKHLRFADKEILPSKYNARKKLFNNQKMPDGIDTRLLHFCGGSKPLPAWQEEVVKLPRNSKHRRFLHLHPMWHQAKKNIKPWRD